MRLTNDEKSEFWSAQREAARGAARLDRWMRDYLDRVHMETVEGRSASALILDMRELLVEMLDLHEYESGMVPEHALRARQLVARSDTAACESEDEVSHLTLGELITELRACDPESHVYLSSGGSAGTLHSYRGRYDCLAIATYRGDARTVASLLQRCEGVVGTRLTSWKGGEYEMGVRTPVYLAEAGETGRRLIGIRIEGSRYQSVRLIGASR